MDMARAASPKRAATPNRPSDKFRKNLNYLSRYWTLYLLLVLPTAYFVIFRYIPMIYIQTAFRDYKLDRGVWQMPWVGLTHFRTAFTNKDFYFALRNTVVLNLLDLVVGFPAPIILAIILNELIFTRFKKFTQTVSYMPHFLSWIIIANLATQLLTPTNGVINIYLNRLGFASIPFLNDKLHWIFTYCILGVWQNLGWGSIIYLAAMTGINPELYEAASVDGASRLRKIWHITLPGIKGTIVTLLIMNLGNILGSGFDRPWALRNNLVLDVSDVLSVFVYNYGLKASKFSLATAVGLFQSVVCVFFLFGSNAIAKKLGERGVW